MNKCFRTLWNARKQAWVAVAETTRAKGKPSSAPRVAVVSTLLWSALMGGQVAAQAPPPNAVPTGGQVSAGQASIRQSGASVVIDQSSDRAAINWQSFDVGSNAQVQFNQPSVSSLTLNRVLSDNPSQIFGRISANGQVILSNPQGVYFGPSARVDVGGLIATTHSLSDADLLAGNWHFERQGSSGRVVNEGELKAALGGYIALLAPEVHNQGAVIAQMGTVALAAGEAIDLSFDRSSRLSSIRVSPSQIQALVDNRMAVQAPGGLVILSAQSVDQLVGGVVNNSGAIEATGMQMQAGRIVLSGSTRVNNAGTLDVSNSQDGGRGGSVSLQGQDITLEGTSQILATGSAGGGTVLVGGNWQGSADPLLQDTGQPTQAATTVSMAAGARIDASATQKGDGGTVVLWSDVHKAGTVTAVQGTIMARAGANGGHGGQIETSGSTVNLDRVVVDAGAAKGQGGQWLIDPYNYTIGSTQASTITTTLNSGTSVTVDTATNNASYGSSGNSADAGNISVTSAMSWTGTGALTLTANGSISIGSALQSQGLLANSNIAGNITLNAGTTISGSGNIQIGPTSGGAPATLPILTLNAGSGSGTLSGTISGYGSLVKTGAGTVQLDGANTFTGGTSIQAGTVAVVGTGVGSSTSNSINALGPNNSAVEVRSGSTLSLTNVVSSWTPPVLKLSGSGTINLISSGSNAYTQLMTTETTADPPSSFAGTLNVSGDGFNALRNSNLSNATVNVTTTGYGLFVSTGATVMIGALTGNGNIKAAASTSTGTLVVGAKNIDTVFTGILADTPPLYGTEKLALTKVGSGTLTLSGTNTYTGTTTVSAGTLLFSQPSALYNASSSSWTATNLVVQNGATLALSVGTSLFTSANVDVVAGLGSASGGFKSGSFLGLDTSAGNFTYASNLTNPGGNSRGFVKSGANTLILSGTNSYTGATSITAGTLQVGNNGTTGTLGSGSVTLSNNANLVYSRSASTTIGNSISGSGNVTASITGTLNDLTVSGAIALTNGTLDLATDRNLIVSANLSTTGSGNITLNAGKSTAAGTSIGGDITLSTPSITVSVGASGQARLFTGSVGNANLTTLVGNASGHFRYNSDEVSANYSSSLGTGLYAIYREAPSLTLQANLTKTYDGQFVTTTTLLSTLGSVSVTSGTLSNGDTGNAAAAGATFSFGGSALQKNYQAGGYAIAGSQTGLSALGYNVSFVNGSLTINKANLSVAAVSDTKTYDGATGSSRTPSVTGLQGSDTVSGLSQSFASKNVLGTNGSTLLLDGFVLSDGNGGQNYNVSTANATGTIMPIAASVSASAMAVSYNASTQTQTVTLNGFLAGEAITVTGQASARNVGTYTSNLLVSGAGAANYSVSVSNANLVINKANLSLSAVSDSKTYDGGTSSIRTPTVTGLQGSDAVSGLSQSFASKNVLGTNGSMLLLSSYVLSDGNGGQNYNVSTATATGTIAPIAASVSASAMAVSYNASTQTQTVSTNGFLVGDAITVTGQASARNAGTYTSSLVVGGASAGNYLISVSNADLVIHKASLSLSAVSDSKTYDGGTNASRTPLVIGLQGSDSISGLSQSFASPHVLGVNGSTLLLSSYVVSDGNGGQNYNISVPSSPVVGTITPASLTQVSASKTYDGLTTVSFSQMGSVVGVNGERFIATAGTANISDKDVGTANKTLTDLSGLTLTGVAGALVSNYSWQSGLPAAGASNAVSIVKASLLQVSASKTYDGLTTVSFSQMGSVVGVNGERFIATAGTANISDKDVGTANKTLTDLSGLTLLGVNGARPDNYRLATGLPLAGANNLVSITQAPLGIEVAAVYNGSQNFTPTSFTVTGLQNGETITAIASFNAADKNVGANGTNKVVDMRIGSGTADVLNYSLNTSYNGTRGQSSTNTVTIIPATITASLQGAVTKTYDGGTAATLTSASVNTFGWAPNEGATVLPLMGEYASKHVSDNKGQGLVSVPLVSGDFSPNARTLLDNYTLPTTVSGAIGTITPASLTVRVNDTAMFVTQNANVARDMGFSYTGLKEPVDQALVSVPTAADRVFLGANPYPQAGSYSGVYGLRVMPVAQNGNYNLTVQPGALQVVPADRLLLTVQSQSDVYGQRQRDNAASTSSVIAQYCLVRSDCNGVNLVTLNMTAGPATAWSATDVTNNTITLDTTLKDAAYSSGGWLKAGQYVYDIANLSSSNAEQFKGYVVNGGTLAISRLQITPTADAISKTYDGRADASGASFTLSPKAGDVVSARASAGSYASVNVVSGANVTYADLSLEGPDKDNYTLPVSVTGVGNITPRTVSLSASKTYDGNANLAGAVTVNTGVAGEVLSYSGAVANSKNVQEASHITAIVLVGSASASISNYVLPDLTAGSSLNSVTISGAMASVSAVSKTATYNASTQTQTVNTWGFLAGDEITLTGLASGRNAGTYTSSLRVGGTGAGNYRISITNADLTISKSDLILEAVSDSKTYDASTNSSRTPQAMGLQGSDSISGLSQSFVSKNVLGLGLSTLQVNGGFAVSDGNGGQNYNISVASSPAVGTITPASLTQVSASKTYDGLTTVSFSQMGSVVGVNGERFIATAGTANISDKDVGTANKTLTDLSGLTLTGVAGALVSNYSWQSGLPPAGPRNGVSITPKSVTLSASKIYDGSTDMSAAVTIATGVAGETLNYTGALANSPNVLQANRISAISLADSASALAYNYALPDLTISSVANTATISPKALTVSLTGTVSKIYDGSIAASLSADNFRIDGLVEGERIRIAQTAGTYDSPHVDANSGSGIVRTLILPSQLTASGAALSNYVLPSTASGAVGAITPAPLSIRVNDATAFVTQSITTAVNNGYTYSGLLAGDSTAGALLQAPSAGWQSYSGPVHPVVGSYTGVFGLSATPVAVHGNYSVRVLPGNLTVIPADQLLVSIASGTDNYGNRTAANAAVASAVTAQYCLDPRNCNGTNLYSLAMTQSRAGHWVARDNTNAAIEFDTTLDSGARYSSAGFLAAGQYSWGIANLSTTVPGQFKGYGVNAGVLQVERLMLTPTAIADRVSKVYDGNESAAGVTLLAPQAKAADDVRVVSALGRYSSKNVTASDTVTFSSLNLQGADKDNYSLSVNVVQGTGAITPRAVTVSGITAADKTYDGTTTATLSTAGARFNNLVEGEVLSVSATGSFADKHVGNAKVVTLNSTYSGLELGNYTITDQSSTTAAITPRAVTVSGITAADKTYDGNTLASVDVTSAVWSNLVRGDRVSLSASGVFLDKNVGNGKLVVLSSRYGGADVGNYTLTDQASTSASITPSAVSDAVNAVSTVRYVGNQDVRQDILNPLPRVPATLDALVIASSDDVAVSAGSTVAAVASDSASTTAPALEAVQASASAVVPKDATPAAASATAGSPVSAAKDMGSDAAPTRRGQQPTVRAQAPLAERPDDKDAKLHVFMVFASEGLAGESFELELPEQTRALFSGNARLTVSLADGSALPAWLVFDARTRKLRVKRLPQGALPLEIMIRGNGQGVLLVVQQMANDGFSVPSFSMNGQRGGLRTGH